MDTLVNLGLVILIVVVPAVALVYFATYDYNDNNNGDA
jgi:hypothetical protein